MAKVVYNGNYSIRNTYNYIDDVKSNLKEAYNTLENASIPSSFGYKEYLKNTTDELKNFYNKVDKLYEWLRKTNRELNDCINDFEDELDRIEVTAIKNR